MTERMRNETMTSKERLECAIHLEKPDRAPIAILNNISAMANMIGKKSWEAAEKGYLAQVEIEMECFDAMGGWDGVTPPLTAEPYYLSGLKVKPPAEGSPEIQILEEELMTIEDYDFIAENGMTLFVVEHLIPRAYSRDPSGKYLDVLQETLIGLHHCIQEYTKRGAHLIFPTLLTHPFFYLSLTRSMVKFTEDLYYRPERVEKALQKMTDELIESYVGMAENETYLTMGLVEERAGGFFYPMKIFERFWWPYTKQIVDAFWKKGICMWIHLDTCWDKNIHYFKELPRGSAIIDLDGTTNIFAAKEQLRGHLAISSDVHPALMSLGKPEEVEAYCKKLIDEVGDDGGLVLCTGCCLPVAAKKENFEAMLRTGKTYTSSK